MEEFVVTIPGEEYTLLNFKQEDLPGVAVVNTALRNFEPKQVFAWHLSVMVQLEDLSQNGMPSESEIVIIDDFGNMLDKEIKGPDSGKPKALALARITWNKTLELVWRVFDPEIANDSLQEILAKKIYTRQFDFKMEEDPEWKLTEWLLKEY